MKDDPAAVIDNPNDPGAAGRAPARLFQPVVDPAGWTAEDMANDPAWLYTLAEAEIDEIRAAVAPFDHADIDLIPTARADFPLPTLGPKLEAIRADIAYGRGFALIRGLPVDALGKRATAIAFWAVSAHLGDGVFSQNKHGHVLGHVTDLGESKSRPDQRGPYSSESIPFHCDCADMVGLLCQETPVSGGESSIISSVSVHNWLLEAHPELYAVMCAPYYRDRRDEVPPGMEPWYELAVFHAHQGYFSANIEPTYMSSPHRFAEVPEMTAVQKEAISVVQDYARAHCFHMGFQRGDMQFLNNHVIFHSRQGYQDHANTEKKRHLLRIWLKLLDARPLPDAFYARHGSRATIDRPGGIVGPDTVLNAPIFRT